MPTFAMRPVHTDDLNTDSQGSTQKSSVSCWPRCVSLFKGELSQRLPIGDPAGRIDTGFYFSIQKEKDIENFFFNLSSHYKGVFLYLSGKQACVACVGQTCCPRLPPCSPILYMDVCAHVHSCMHTYTQILLTQVRPIVGIESCALNRSRM